MPENNQTVSETDAHKVRSEQISIKELAWRVHPLAENWKRSSLLLLFLTSVLAVIYSGFQSFFILLLSVFLLLGPLYKYFLPFQYHLRNDNLVITTLFYKRQHLWSTFRSHYVDKNGVLMSPFSEPTRLENFRGVYVRFGKQPPDEIIHFIECKLNAES